MKHDEEFCLITFTGNDGCGYEQTTANFDLALRTVAVLEERGCRMFSIYQNGDEDREIWSSW